MPPTVFAPDGRLFGVERVAREAMMGPSSTTTGDQIDEDSCCTVFAIRCGRGSQCKVTQGKQQQADNPEQIIENSTEDHEDEFAVVVGIGPISPFLHRDMEILEQEKQQQQQLLKQELALEHRDDDDDEQEPHDGQQSAFCKPLVLEYNTTQQQQLSSMSSPTTTSQQLPISILSPSLITAVGGTSPIDSTILLRRSIEVALSMYKLDNGGVHFFASHSLESDNNGGEDNDGRSSSGINVSGGASGVQIESLVRRIADMAQSSTQNLGGKYGRMLSSSLLAVGNDNSNSRHQNDNDDKLCIWRVDPTGQFWKCEASAVGYGTMEVEAELLSRARAWKKSITMKDDESLTESKATTRTRTLNRKDVDEDEEEMMNDVIISNKDVRMYLASLTEDEAVKVASDCLVDGLLNCNRSAAADVQKEVIKNKNEVSIRDWKAYDLRRRIQCVVLRRWCNGGVKVI